VVWGHETGYDEDFARPFSGIWSGSGVISGSGNEEIMTLDPGENMEGEIVEIGAIEVQILINKYRTGSGPAPTVKYKDGNTYEDCDADIWNLYSSSFTSQGFVKVRVEA
jgi:hypothetical protein